jgi:hypothetical protein
MLFEWNILFSYQSYTKYYTIILYELHTQNRIVFS